MSTSTMHFGPEWMRAKPQSSARTQPLPSPPPSSSNIPASGGASTYSALVSPAAPPPTEKRDEAHPFRYSKEEMLRIYREGGGKGGLGLEVERWEGVVREAGSDPVGLREMSEGERKIFAGSVNSELRRRQSSDFLSPLSTQNLERPRLNHNNTGSTMGSPLRDRFGSLLTRRGTDPSSPTVPRKLSFSNQPPLNSPRDAGVSSPRTRGFDGVLNNGDSWLARRRASEGAKSATIRDGPGESQADPLNGEIREEDENTSSVDSKPENNTMPRSSQPDSSGLSANEPRSVSGPSEITTGVGNLYLDTNGKQSAGHSPAPSSAGLNPPPSIDLASVEWSYLDPQGDIQGPFRADIMQKWHDDGYFSPDLLMKRTTLDKDWQTVAALSRQSTDKIFLSPPVPIIPPGISRRTESPQQVPPLHPDPNVFSAPFQPAPVRSLRSSTLDYTGSNPSDSPSSSFGGGRFSNGSPDASAFGGRAGNSYDTMGLGRNFPLADSPSPFTGRRNTFADVGSPALSNMSPARGSSTDGYPYNQGFGPAQSSWPGGNTFDGVNHVRGSVDSMSYSGVSGSGLGSAGLHAGSSFGGQREQGFQNDYAAVPDQNYGGFGTMVFSNPAHRQFAPPPGQVQGSLSTFDEALPSSRFGSQQPGNIQTVGVPAIPVSPWGNVPDGPPIRRPGPFDAGHPTSNNTIISQPITPSQPSPWRTTSRPAAPGNDSRPENTIEETPSSLTFTNLGQHNQQQEELLRASELPAPPVAESSQQTIAVPELPVKPPPPRVITATTRAREKSISQNVAPSPSVPKPNAAQAPVIQQPTQRSPSPSSSPSAAPKPAWMKEDEAKKSKGSSMSLREIQEAETKKSESRKAAEREREKAARAAVAPSASSNEDLQSFSWGLPTSHVGRNPPAPSKDAGASPSTVPPVWTGAAKAPPAKKSMKEIQEEEERRRKAAVKESAAAVASRRAYAESMNKTAPPPLTQGAAWTTVGPGGKLASTAPVPSRPAPPNSASATPATSSSVPRPNGIPARPPPAAVKAPSAPPKDDLPVTPSHDFLKWLNESLKGLNPTVNVEEIMSMLLTFPMDPDASTTELIAEMIYTNSTTLDGRRFAAEFINKRKADAASRPKGAGSQGVGSGKPISIADVVKSQPKPQASSEWGGFKVVNKKKKGGRT